MVLSNAFVFSAYNVFAVDSLKSANREMPSGYVLKMLDERVVHGSATQRTNDGKSLCRDLLRHYHAKAGRHLRNEADKNWGTFLDNTALCEKASLLHYNCFSGSEQCVRIQCVQCLCRKLAQVGEP